MEDLNSGNGRHFHRNLVMQSFHVYIVIPHLGSARIDLIDISEGGFSFCKDTADSFTINDEMECHFYINPSIRIPLSVKIAHMNKENNCITVGCELADNSKDVEEAFKNFVKLLASLSRFVTVRK